MGKIIIDTKISTIPKNCGKCKYRFGIQNEKVEWQCVISWRHINLEERDSKCPLQDAKDFVADNFNEIW